MSKLTRIQRVLEMLKYLVERPGELIPQSYFVERYGAAKSTISEDIALLRETVAADGGLLRTHAGAIGGVQYWPVPAADDEAATLSELCRLLSDPARILPGGFVYMSDVLTHPVWTARLGAIMAGRFLSAAPDLVLTVETKGIPLALMTARALGVPMAFARQEGRVTEGPSISIHYISGSSRRVSAMTAGLRAVPRDARVLVVDDFMKAGATARAMVDLVTELGAAVVGVGTFTATAEPAKKRVDEYVSLLTVQRVDEDERTVEIHPSDKVKE